MRAANTPRRSSGERVTTARARAVAKNYACASVSVVNISSQQLRADNQNVPVETMC